MLEMGSVERRSAGNESNSSYAGSTRVSIDLHNKLFSKQMDCRVKPGNDGWAIYAAVAGGSASTE